MDQVKQLFVVGPALSGTTYLTEQLNQSEDIYLFSQLNSFLLEKNEGKEVTENGFNFAEKFNLQKTNEGIRKLKGKFIPNVSQVRSVDELYTTLGHYFKISGEEIALGSFTIDGKHVSEILLEVQTTRYYNARHLVILRDPIATLDSMSKIFSAISLREHFEWLLSSYRVLIELLKVLPRSRLVLYERLGDDAFSAIFDWLGLKRTSMDRINLEAPVCGDFACCRAELQKELPDLEQLENLYKLLAELTCDLPLWFRSEKEQFVSDSDYEFVASGLRALQTKVRNDRIRCHSTRSIETIGTPGNLRRVILKTDHSVAVDSIDHIYPLGTRQDNYRSLAFTDKLFNLYTGQSLAVMDLGCAGGGFVKDINDAGHLGIGLEGSDYSLIRKRAEWGTIPDRLYTCDCTKPFAVSSGDRAGSTPILFDVVTAWEFLEHIKADDLAAVFQNVTNHLNPEIGLFIASVHLRECEVDGHQYHATVRPEWWWRDKFRKNGFYILDRALDFFEEDWVRGPKDEENTFGTCHIVASLWPDNEIVRRVDRAACGRFEHGHIGRVELRQIANEALDKVTKFENDIANLALKEPTNQISFSPALIRVLAAHVIERCLLEKFERIAIFGAGSHTTNLIPIWQFLGGPAIKAIIVSQDNGAREIAGVPLFRLGDTLPSGIQAILPSSHQHESEMRAMAAKSYPDIPWLFVWHPIVRMSGDAKHPLNHGD